MQAMYSAYLEKFALTETAWYFGMGLSGYMLFGGFFSVCPSHPQTVH
jgi:hypothetical protein